jgi:SAM-dependent MidA family methyltransferase
MYCLSVQSLQKAKRVMGQAALSSNIVFLLEPLALSNCKLRGKQVLALLSSLLLSPAEMGELFKVPALARWERIAWPGFALADRTHRV